MGSDATPVMLPGQRAPGRKRRRRTTGRRTAAVIAIGAALWTLGLAVVVAVYDFPRGVLFLLCGLVVAAGSWEGVLRRGWGRVAALTVAALALVAAIRFLADEGFLRSLLLLGIGGLVWFTAARLAFDPHVVLSRALPPQRAVLFINPRSGDGKAARFRLAAEARERGIEPVELGPDGDLESLARAAVRDGADGIAMAGGDGSQAVVASIAAEVGLPYACIPAGTRNHFALDLGVDRDDVVGALDALVDGRERVVDLGEINGRVFVNNVSLGLYAEAVQQDRYRGAKIRTLLDTIPALMGPEGNPLDLRWTGPQGDAHATGTVILVSNNTYRLGRALGSGTRPRIDDGRLGIAVLAAGGDGGRHRWQQWSAPTFEVGSDEPVPIGMDGEKLLVDPPLRFGIRPRALRVRIAPAHPGASPSAAEPDSAPAAIRALARLAAGRDGG